MVDWAGVADGLRGKYGYSSGGNERRAGVGAVGIINQVCPSPVEIEYGGGIDMVAHRIETHRIWRPFKSERRKCYSM